MSLTAAPYGIWDSPITAQYVAKAAATFDDVLVDPLAAASSSDKDDLNGVYYIEKRPNEGGRNVIVDASTKKDVFGQGWNARSAVQEYGGASAVVFGGVIYFTNFGDMRVYKIDRSSGDTDPVSVTPENKNHRFANFTVHPTLPHLLVSIMEDHTNPKPCEVATYLVIIDTKTGTIHPLVSGADFYAAPTFNKDGTRIAWVQWNHPDMPWDGAQVVAAEIIITNNNNGSIEGTNPRRIKGVPSKVSAVRPQWVDEDVLLFFSDETGFQNPYIIDIADVSSEAHRMLPTPLDEDFAEPDWQLGYSSAAVLTDSSAFVVSTREGRNVLYLLDLQTGSLKDIPSTYVVVKNIRRTDPRSAVFLGTKTDEPTAIVRVSLDESGAGNATLTPLITSSSPESTTNIIDKPFFSIPRPLSLHGREGFPLYAVYYPPANPTFVGREGEKPPCIVSAHGGPTGMADQGFNLRKQFFTSRGFAWVDVNYGGSSGYGREYRERLDGLWGIVDVNDVCDAALALSTPPTLFVDPSRVVITGGSAGGYTVLQSLCSGRSSIFAAGTSSFGVSNLFTLIEDTHKFESRYMDKLLGGSPEVKIPHVIRARSPVYHADKIKVPLLILQGAEDKVVPPSQAEEIVKVIREHGGRVEYELYEGEGHGWRRAETIVAALERELSFYLDVFGLKKK